MTDPTPNMSGINVEALLATARGVLVNSYAPYSKIRVAAAILFEDDSVVTGVNVENASYGLTICAEQSAMVSAVSQGKCQFKAVAITTNGQKPISPCGACRQILSEFAMLNAVAILDTGEGHPPIVYALSELLPAAFKPTHLLKTPI